MLNFNKIYNKFKPKAKYTNLVQICIDEKQLLANYEYYKSLINAQAIAPVLKSNAYGHGLLQIASVLDKTDCPFLVIDSYFEALYLRTKGIKKPLLIIGYTNPENILTNKLANVSFTITNKPDLDLLSYSIKKPTNLHIKFDTGMHRQGLCFDDLVQIVPYLPDGQECEATKNNSKNVPRGTIKKNNDYNVPRGTINALLQNKNINIEGICTHFAENDINSIKTLEQIEKWNEVVERMSELFKCCKYFHIAASYGLENLHSFYNNKNVPRGTLHQRTNLIRLGIGLYGLTKNTNTKPVLSLYTLITNIQKIKSGESIGYDSTFVAKNDMKIATIPIGYYEGVDRRLSNTGLVKVLSGQKYTNFIQKLMDQKQNDSNQIVPRGTIDITDANYCLLVGRVSMNIATIDVTGLNVNIGDLVQVISVNRNEENSINTIADKISIIPYEVVVHLSEKMRRTCV